MHESCTEDTVDMKFVLSYTVYMKVVLSYTVCMKVVLRTL